MKKEFLTRSVVILISILILGVGVGILRIASLGTDPFTCMNLGVSSMLRNQLGLSFLTFGIWQIVTNLAILSVVFFMMQRYIGLGTIMNMLLVGIVSDIVVNACGITEGTAFYMLARLFLLLVGVLIICISMAFYMESNLGLSPYDTVAFLLEKLTGGRLRFQWGRVVTDTVCVTIGILCASMLGIQWTVAGMGTVIMAFGTGPLVQWFRTNLVAPLIHRNHPNHLAEGKRTVGLRRLCAFTENLIYGCCSKCSDTHSVYVSRYFKNTMAISLSFYNSHQLSVLWHCFLQRFYIVFQVVPINLYPSPVFIGNIRVDFLIPSLIEHPRDEYRKDSRRSADCQIMHNAVFNEKYLHMEELGKHPYHNNHHWMDDINDKCGCPKQYTSVFFPKSESLKQEVHTR